MSFQRLWAVARKESLHILRDPRSLAMAIALPVLLLFLFGYALTLDVDDVPLAVWDQSGSPASRELISRFSGSRYFSVRLFSEGYPGLERAMDTREALAALVIPRDFGARVASGRPAVVQLLLDGSDSNTATIASGYASGVTDAYSQFVTVRTIHRTRGAAAAALLRPPLDLRPRVWFNTDLESKNYIIPGLIAVVIMVIAALLTSLTVAREWERGTMEQLISTPVKGPELIGGKLLPYFAIGMFDVFLAVLMGEFLFHVPLRGSVALLFCMSGIFVTGALSMGLLISVATKNQLLANQLAFVTTFLPSFLLSGFIYAIRNMPVPVQVITHVVPARYFIALLKSIYLKGVGLEVLAGEAALLSAFAAGMVILANLKFKKKLG
ncbi:MAG: ABC transporter permease [Deltaproteobacteria bacterium]|nr:ABC transporter permease [Deltaproteobacteria bacterium]